ncbi:MAG: ribonucleoside-diphosphate reductase subunit alpha, partial [Pseudomonadota bacterium]
HVAKRRIEMPQAFFMRVAMGLALNEIDREARAIEFYEVLSSFDFMSSTPTLFNAGTRRSQLSSCYLTTVSDDLDGIYEALKENALLSKFAGGLGNDWSRVRALGSYIKGTNGKSQGVVPFLKVVNDTAVAVNQGGKRKGAVCSYLESWHLDIEEFLELRKNTGDDRRRTHDMNTANWIPDLFMKRVMEGGEWTLFSPADVPALHDKFGADFERAYLRYEQKVAEGELRLFKKVAAVQLWRKMLSMLFETGHPWITFKDPCNIRSPQQHTGVVHSSNLCTEITLNTGDSEIAVCNLGSVNLKAHLRDGRLDHDKLKATITVAMRMLDNVIDLNYYAVGKARNSNMRHRPVGLGIMGYQDCLHELRIPTASEDAVEFADRSMEVVAYYAIQASSDLAAERGCYASYRGSLWDRGILPIDTLKMLREQRGGYVECDESTTLDWDALRARVARQGMRNSNTMAIAPTATIANITGVSQCIEPTFQNLYVKSNLSGEFTVVNEYLVRDLKKLGMWDEVMIADLKYFDGSLARIDRVPPELRALYATAFEIDPRWLVEAAARRQKWIDQAQSLNIYMGGASGKRLDDTYKLAWLRGLKTTYYPRTLGATHAEKSTIAAGQLNAVPVSGGLSAQAAAEPAEPKFCAIDDPECEACQ